MRLCVLYEDTEASFEALINFFEYIKTQKNPKVDDLITFGNMMKYNFGDNLFTYMSDMLPFLPDIIERTNDPDFVKLFFAKLGDSPRWKIFVGWENGWSSDTVAPWVFDSCFALENAIKYLVDLSNVGSFFSSSILNLFSKIWANNKEGLENCLDPQFLDDLHNWALSLESEIKKSNLSMSAVLKDLIRKITEEDEDY